jgi:hypothetical protein
MKNDSKLGLTKQNWGKNGEQVNALVVYPNIYNEKLIETMHDANFEIVHYIHSASYIILRHKEEGEFYFGYRLEGKWPTKCPEHPNRPLMDGRLPFCPACNVEASKRPELIDDVDGWKKAWDAVSWT